METWSEEKGERLAEQGQQQTKLSICIKALARLVLADEILDIEFCRHMWRYVSAKIPANSSGLPLWVEFSRIPTSNLFHPWSFVDVLLCPCQSGEEAETDNCRLMVWSIWEDGKCGTKVVGCLLNNSAWLLWRICHILSESVVAWMWLNICMFCVTALPHVPV